MRTEGGAVSFKASAQLGLGVLPSNRFDETLFEVIFGARQLFPMPSRTGVCLEAGGEVCPEQLDNLEFFSRG